MVVRLVLLKTFGGDKASREFGNIGPTSKPRIGREGIGLW